MALGTTLAGVSELGALVLDFLGDAVGYLLFSGVEGDSVKSHTEQQSHQTEQKLCDLCWGKKWDPVIGKAAKLSKDCPWKLELSQMRQQQETWEQD